MKEDILEKNLKHSILKYVINEDYIDEFKAKLRAEIFSTLMNNKQFEESGVNVVPYSKNDASSSSKSLKENEQQKNNEIYDYIAKIIIMDYLDHTKMLKTLTMFQLEAVTIPEVIAEVKEEIFLKITEASMSNKGMTKNEKPGLDQTTPMITQIIKCLDMDLYDFNIESSIASDDNSKSDESNI